MARKLIFQGAGNLNAKDLSALTGVSVIVSEGETPDRCVVSYEPPIDPTIERIIMTAAQQKGYALRGTNNSS